MTSQRFTVVVEIDAENNTAQAFGEFNKGVNSVGTSSKLLDGIMNAVGQRIVGFAQNLPAAALQAVKLGSQVEASAVRFERFAGSAERADKLLEAFNEATNNTVDRMGAMSSAGRLLQMGLVSNADEMARVARIATMLGDQTLGTTARMSDFAALLANQSIPRLDNFGISSGKVRARIKELQAQTEGLSREQAFNTAVMEEGEKALVRLGDTSDLASTKIDRLESAWKTLGQVAAESTAQLATSGTLLDRVADGLNQVAQRTLDVNEGLEKAKELGVAPRIFATAFADASVAARTFQKDEDELRASIEETTRAIVISTDATQTATGANFEYDDSIGGVETRTVDAGVSALNLERSYRRMAAAARKAAADAVIAADDQARAVRALAIESSANFTSFAQRSEESAKDLAERREDIESTHAENLAKITKRGQSTAIRINVAAEETKLTDLQRNLTIALLDQADFTEKTKEQAIIRKEAQIAKLQEGVAAQEKLLADFRAGRLFRGGENITGLLAQEQERHDESLLLLKEAAEEQELANQQSLGRIVLAHFNAWAAIHDVSADRILETQLFIQEKFGLITEEGADLARSFSADFAIIKDVGVDAFIKIKEGIDAIPRKIEILFSVREEGRAAAVAEFGAALPEFAGVAGGFQSGGVSGGGLARMNEGGGEMVILPRGAQVVNNNQTDNFIMNLTSQTPAGPIQEFELMRALAGRG